MDTDEEWISDEDVTPELRAKILCLNVCRNRSLAYASSDKAIEVSTPVIKLFMTLLENNGSLSPDSAEEYVASLPLHPFASCLLSAVSR